MVLAPRRAVDDEQADVLADLRCGQPHAVGFAEREEHVFDQFFQAGVIGRDIFGRVAQRLRTVNDNRVNHGVIRSFSIVVFRLGNSSEPDCTRLNEKVEFLSSFSRLGIARTKFGSALGLTKWFDIFPPQASW